MDHSYIDEHNLPERYVLGRLDDTEQIRFEEHYVDCERCLEQVELVQSLAPPLIEELSKKAVGLAEQQTAEPQNGRDTPNGEGLKGSVVSFPSRQPRFVPWAAAALLALALLPSFWLASRNRALSSEIEALREPRAAAPGLVLQTARSVSEATVPTLVVAPGQQWATLAVDVGVVEDLEAHMTLTNGIGDTLWIGEGLDPSPWGPFLLSFPADLLPEGDYQLQVELIDSSGRAEPAGTFPFRVTPGS